MKLNQPMIISHLYEYDGCWHLQSNEDHSKGVADMAASFAADFGMSSWGRILGLLHDKGKEREAFQQYIRSASGLDTTHVHIKEHNHAYVGGLIARKMYGETAQNLLTNPIASHHRGLYDNDELDNTLKEKTIPDEVKMDCLKISLDRPDFQSMRKEDFHHLCRMLFSCLVDADYLDTEQFMDPESASLRKGKSSLQELLPKLARHLEALRLAAKDTAINRIRNEVQQRCVEMAEMEKGFYSLTVPTGGGKTLSSLAWAMRHAVYHGMKRIIIAIPYTSIIVQTAAILKGIFGEENVLEHHSNVNSENIKDEQLKQKMQLAMENWDYPIVVTTNVRMFESMFDNKPSVCRKLHNIVNSILILDEVQTLPTGYLQPIVDTLRSYQKMFVMSVLFTTASQPVLEGLIEGCNPNANFKGLKSVKEIIPKEMKLHERLKRVHLDIDDTPRSYDEIAQRLCYFKRVLCIVNTRRDAKELFKRLPKEGITLHLSRMMCPDHVNETINKIKAALKEDSNKIIRVVSTQLVEAGVDIDFPVVFRQEAGLDSVLQAAGRCNREGRLGISTTYVFSLAKEHLLPMGEISDADNARKNLGENRDWFAPDTMTDYFKFLYSRKESFDKAGIKEFMYDRNNLMFETAAKKFQLIDNKGISLVVCWKDSMDLVERLKEGGTKYSLLKRLSKYMVNVYASDFKALKEAHAVTETVEGVFVVEQQAQYDKDLGLLIENQWEDKLLLI